MPNMQQVRCKKPAFQTGGQRRLLSFAKKVSAGEVRPKIKKSKKNQKAKDDRNKGRIRTDVSRRTDVVASKCLANAL